MDYTHIRLTGLNTIDLAIQDAQHDDAFIIKGADGLGPSDIQVSIAGGLDSGGYFQNKVPTNKQIVIRIGLNPYWNTVGGTPSDLRETLYGLLTGGYTGDKIAVTLVNIDPVTLSESEVCRIYGYVSKFETVPFSKDPQVQITIECLSPYFEDLEIYTVGSGLSTTTPAITNPGTGPTGFNAMLTFSGLGATLPYFEITDQSGLHKMRFDPPANWANGDWISFETSAGSRFVTMKHGADIFNGLPWLTTDSDWLQLYGGLNVLNMSDSHFVWNSFIFTPKYWGV